MIRVKTRQDSLRYTKSEFSLIEEYFMDITRNKGDVILGIGDDCALLECPDDHVIAVSIDTLVEGIHFFKAVDPETLGYRSLAVGLSDLAAMGAEPAWFTVSLTLPSSNSDIWLRAFSQGMSILAKQYDIQLVGGDTTRGPMSISIQVYGFVKAKLALRRNGAQAGDLIYVSGTLGDAGAALQLELQRWDHKLLTVLDKLYLVQRLEQPTPRLRLGISLLNYATSAIDISDSLSADLSHILRKSGVGATVELAKLPLSSSLQKISIDKAIQFALSSGDDYELCFTIPPTKLVEFKLAVVERCTLIGRINDIPGLVVIASDGQEQLIIGAGYNHFSIIG